VLTGKERKGNFLLFSLAGYSTFPRYIGIARRLRFVSPLKSICRRRGTAPRARLSCALWWLGAVNCLTRVRPRSPSRQAVSADPSQGGGARSHRRSRNILVRNILEYQQYEDRRWHLPRRLARVLCCGCRRVARFLLSQEPSACHGFPLPRMEHRASAFSPATAGAGRRSARRRGTRPRARSFG